MSQFEKGKLTLGRDGKRHSNISKTAGRGFKALLMDAGEVIVVMKDKDGNELETTRNAALAHQLYQDALDINSKTKLKSTELILNRILGKPGQTEEAKVNDVAKLVTDLATKKAKEIKKNEQFSILKNRKNNFNG